MEPRSLKYVAAACAGELQNASPELAIRGICTDSRKAQAGDLFFALSGERFDGHDFLDEVASKGVTAVVVARGKVPAERKACGVITVENTRQALGSLAARYRADFELPIVAVGGSNGKTTTKELLAAVLRQKFSTLWSEASFNNEVGVPLTLLKLERPHAVAVLEAGTNHPGELAPLVRMIQPRFGVITSVGREHLEYFNDLHGVAKEEGWLAELLPVDGKLFVNGDSFEIDSIVRRTSAQVVRVGVGNKNDWTATYIRLDDRGTTFRVAAPMEKLSGEYRINLLGRHQVTNALLALAVGAQFGLTREEMQRGLTECKPPKMRLQVWTVNGVRVLDDAYNANADSMLAALQTLCELPCEGRRIAVLGDMAELGVHSEAAHAEVGRQVGELKINQLFAVGKMATVLATAARAAGPTKVCECAEVEAGARTVKGFVLEGDLVLIKASRAMRLERVGRALRGEEIA